MVNEVDFSIPLQNSPKGLDHSGLSLRTSLGCLIVTTERISEPWSPRWMNSGIAWRGEYWTQNTSEAPKDAVARSLSQVIKRTAPLESFLGPELLNKWLRRHDYLGRTLPADLRSAIETQISTLSNTPASEESQPLVPRRKDIVVMENRTRLTLEEAPILYVRRMLASEYEALQGFPETWTDVDSGL